MLELAEDELNNFFKVWALIFVSLSYCYGINKITCKGFTRLVSIIPIIIIFLVLPLSLTSFHLGGFTAFFIAWLANFKLLLFAFGEGPLCTNPSISFPHFIALACIPIKIQNSQNSSRLENNNKSPQISVWNYIIKAVLIALIIKIYDFNDCFHPKVLWMIFCFHIYFTLELGLAILTTLARLSLGFELEPPFIEPLLSTSLQDFWSKRWNLMVTRILRPSVYLPTLKLYTKVLGRKWAPLPAVMTTFLVSAIMHELIFYYLGRESPTFEVTCFFLLHGFCLCGEVMINKLVAGKWKLPSWISNPLTVAFVVVTAFWLFLPPLIRAGLDTRPFQEFAAVANFATTLKPHLTLLFY